MVELTKTIDGKDYHMKADEATAKRLVETDPRFKLAKDVKPPEPKEPKTSSDPKGPGKE